MWIWKNKTIDHISKVPNDAIGFIYKITNNDTGEYYIGKKNLWAIRSSTRKGSKKKVKVTKESNWLKYKSSSAIVKSWDNITKEILEFSNTKRGLTYLEAKYLFKNDALEDTKCMNRSILGKFFSQNA